MLTAATSETLPPGRDGSWPLTGTLDLRAAPDAVPRGRHFAGNALHRWNFPGQMIDDVEVVTSELVTNAVQACLRSGLLSVRPVTLTIRSNFGSVVVEVTDPVAEPPQPRGQVLGDDDAEAGRGLNLVAFFSTSWGYYTITAGKSVWAFFQRYTDE